MSKQEITREISSRFLTSYQRLYGLGLVKSKTEYCKSVGMQQQNYSRIEKGQLGCTVNNIYLLVKHYHVSLAWLFFGEGEFVDHASAAI